VAKSVRNKNSPILAETPISGAGSDKKRLAPRTGVRSNLVDGDLGSSFEEKT